MPISYPLKMPSKNRTLEPAGSLSILDWQSIDRVFLDMDGTLLDLHFDNYFWLEYVPRCFAKIHGLNLETARQQVLARYASREGTLEWYCVDHWSQELSLDIRLLKEEVDHLIRVHPAVIDFLNTLAAWGKRRVLVTNAHQKSLSLKLQRTPLAGYLEAILCAHDLGLAKESLGFWERVQGVEPFDPTRTLLVDDSLAVLRTARHYGIAWLLAVRRPDSQGPEKTQEEFPSIASFAELLSGQPVS